MSNPRQENDRALLHAAGVANSIQPDAPRREGCALQVLEVQEQQIDHLHGHINRLEGVIHNLLGADALDNKAVEDPKVACDPCGFFPRINAYQSQVQRQLNRMQYALEVLEQF